jgi:hypothetical protein
LNLKYTLNSEIVMITTRVYEEVIDFLAAGASPQEIIAFQPSKKSKQRIADLIYQEKKGSLSPEKKSELDHFMQLEHIMRFV